MSLSRFNLQIQTIHQPNRNIWALYKEVITPLEYIDHQNPSIKLHTMHHDAALLSICDKIGHGPKTNQIKMSLDDIAFQIEDITIQALGGRDNIFCGLLCLC